MIQLVALSLVCAIIVVYLRSINSELSMLALIGSGIIIIAYVFDYVAQTFSVINTIVELSGVNKEFYVIIFKITAIGYLVEFAADTINDFGLKSLADKLVFAGKIVIFVVSLPIIYAVCNLVIGLLQ